MYLKSYIEHSNNNEVSTPVSSRNPRCTFVAPPWCQKAVPRRSFQWRTA